MLSVTVAGSRNADLQCRYLPVHAGFHQPSDRAQLQNRTIGLIENGSWAPTAAKVMKGMFEKSKNITWTENNVKVMSAVKEENVKEIEHWPKNSANKKLRREERIWEKCSAGLCERQRQRSLSFSSFGKKILWSSGGSRIALRWVKKSRG